MSSRSHGPLVLAWTCLWLGTTAHADEPAAAPPQIAVLPLVGKRVPAELVSVLDELLTTELARTGKYRVISAADLNAMLTLNKMQDALGCDNVACAAEIGAALGVELLLSGSVSRLGSTVMVNLALIDTRVQQVAARGSGDAPDREDRYAEAVRAAVAQVCGLPPPPKANPTPPESPPAQPTSSPTPTVAPEQSHGRDTRKGRPSPSHRAAEPMSGVPADTRALWATLGWPEPLLESWFAGYQKSAEKSSGMMFPEFVLEQLTDGRPVVIGIGVVGLALAPLAVFGVRDLLATPITPSVKNVALIAGGVVGFATILSSLIVGIGNERKITQLRELRAGAHGSGVEMSMGLELEGIAPLVGTDGSFSVGAAFSF